jgi:hypothetical protein
MNGKYRFVVSFCCVIIFSVNGSLKPKIYNNSLNIDKSQITSINISAFPERFEPITVSDTSDVNNIVDYLVSIKPDISNDTLKWAGGGFLIIINLKDSSQRVIQHSGNRFLIEKGRFKYNLQYEEAIKIDGIVASILENKLVKNGDSSVAGTVQSINSEASGLNRSCAILSQNGLMYDVDLSRASIIDSTGNGWLILHENDIVRVFYRPNRNKIGFLLASKVFIKKSGK